MASSPPVRLTSLELRLMEAIDRRGLRGFVSAVTAVSVVLSVGITMPLLVAIGSRRAELLVGLGASLSVPSMVAPGAAMMLGRLLQALAHASSELHHLSRTDPLTGAANRRAFSTDASELLDRRGTGVFVVAMVDVDEFKAVNDRFGHPAGDQVLVTLAGNLVAVVEQRCRDAVVGRMGGDEFAVAAVVGSDAEAAHLIDALRQACDLADERPGITASVGAHIAPASATATTATTGATDAVSLDEALAHADHALYRFKQLDRSERAGLLERAEHREQPSDR